MSYCEALVSLPEGEGKMFFFGVTVVPMPEGFGQQARNSTDFKLAAGIGELKALQKLNLWNCKSLASLPEGDQ